MLNLAMFSWVLNSNKYPIAEVLPFVLLQEGLGVEWKGREIKLFLSYYNLFFIRKVAY